MFQNLTHAHPEKYPAPLHQYFLKDFLLWKFWEKSRVPPRVCTVGKIIDVYVVPSDTKPEAKPEPVTGTPQLSRPGLTTLSSDSRPPPAPEKFSALEKKTWKATTEKKNDVWCILGVV